MNLKKLLNHFRKEARLARAEAKRLAEEAEKNANQAIILETADLPEESPFTHGSKKLNGSPE